MNKRNDINKFIKINEELTNFYEEGIKKCKENLAILEECLLLRKKNHAELLKLLENDCQK